MRHCGDIMIYKTERQRKRLLQAAEGYLTLRMPDQALEALKQAGDADAKVGQMLTASALTLKAEELRDRAEHDQALSFYVRALELRPKDLDVLMGMAWCYKRIGQIERSIESMRVAYQHHPDECVVLYNLACYYSLAGQKDQALSWLGRALRMNRDLCHSVHDESDFDPIRNDPDFKHLLELAAE